MKTTLDDAKAILRPRNPQGHKGTFGHGLLLAGSIGMAGAAMLGGKAALRSGMGKLTVASREENRIILQTGLPEALFLGAVPTALDSYDAIAVGPGLGQDTVAESVVEQVLKQESRRLVIDADGLSLLSRHDNWPTLLPENAVLTPHLGEWHRLAQTLGVAEADPVEAACQCAQRHTIYIIIKGHRSSICTPQGRAIANTTGNSGMATAGSGDVLTGILLSLLAQGYGHEEACRLGVWLHGQAGDIAAQQLGEHSLLASDITKHLSDAFKSLI